MRHAKIKYNIGTNAAHRKALLRNLACEVIEHGKIKTSLTKCKAIRPLVEKLVTLAKKDSVANRRLAFAKLGDKKAVKRLFDVLAPEFQKRQGGYTRIFKLADGRIGDNAKMAFIALTCFSSPK